MDYAAGKAQTQDIASGLTPNTTYYFAVVVQDEAGNKALYAPNNATTLALFTVTGATAPSNTAVEVNYSHASNSTQAQNTSNYKIVAGSNCADTAALSISAASLSGNVVTLTTSSQSLSSYTVYVADGAGGVTRQSDGVMLNNNTASFVGNIGPFNVTGATSTSTNSVTIDLNGPPTQQQ